MAEKKKTTTPQRLSTKDLRAMKPAERSKLLVEKHNELREARMSLVARELTNPRKITQLRREVAVIKTVDNESVEVKETT